MLNILERKGERIVAIAALALVVYISSLCLVGQVISALQSNKTISNVGAVKAIGVGVYLDPGCTNTVTSINWGMVEPGSTVNRTCYIRNEGNSASTLELQTSNWSPSEAGNDIDLSWDVEGFVVEPQQVLSVQLTLSVSSSIQNITSFSFDITISATG